MTRLPWASLCKRFQRSCPKPQNPHPNCRVRRMRLSGRPQNSQGPRKQPCTFATFVETFIAALFGMRGIQPRLDKGCDKGCDEVLALKAPE